MIDAFFVSLWELTAAMAPYILFGLLFAGLLHELLPNDFIQKHMGNNDSASVLKATVFGIPLPVCSCGVIPLAAAIQKKGASRGAVLAFLIATPITGIDSILATFGIFGLFFTLYRILGSIAIAVIAGLLSNLFIQSTQNTQANSKATPLFTPQPGANKGVAFAPMPPSQEGCGCDKGCNESGALKRFDLRSALRYGFVTLFGDIAKPLLFGLLIGAAITVAIPQDLSLWLAQSHWLGYLIAVAVAVPMYVCATASLPIAASLVLGGVSMGAAFVFLSAGPATNTVTIGVVKKMLGFRAVTIYLLTIIIGSILLGIGIDIWFTNLSIDPKTLVHLEENPSLVAALSSVILWVMIVRALLPKKKKVSCCGA